ANFSDALAMARDTDTPFVNLHLVTWQRDFPEFPPESADAGLIDRVSERMLADVAAAIEAVGRERLILENIPYFGRSSEFHRACVEPRVIRRVVDETGCGLLLDLSHARIAAHYLGVDPQDRKSTRL